MKHESILEWRSTGSTEPDHGVCGRKSGQRDIRPTISRLFQEPQSFENVVQLIRYMADFYDSIRFPESSVVLREFTSEKCAMEELHEKSVEYQQLMEQNGICATFHIFVKYRQNATWQGILAWKEGHQEMKFCSVLELIIEMDAILGRK